MKLISRSRGAVALFSILTLTTLGLGASAASAQNRAALPASGKDCSGLPSHDQLEQLVSKVVAEGGNGGLGFNMWASVVNRDGFVCAVAYSGQDRGAQWPGSRLISAQKAYTANAFSQPPDGIGGGPLGVFQGLSLSTANLFTQVQPGNSLFGLQESNPINTPVAYKGDATLAGEADDPLVGEKIGGINVFGGGLALYTSDTLVGAIGVSGDTSCTDHVIAWKMRDGLDLDHIPSGVLPRPAGDNIIFDTQFGSPSPSGFGHPQCVPPATVEAAALPLTHPLGTPAS